MPQIALSESEKRTAIEQLEQKILASKKAKQRELSTSSNPTAKELLEHSSILYKNLKSQIDRLHRDFNESQKRYRNQIVSLEMQNAIAQREVNDFRARVWRLEQTLKRFGM